MARKTIEIVQVVESVEVDGSGLESPSHKGKSLSHKLRIASTIKSISGRDNLS